MAEKIKNDFVVFNEKFAVYANSRVEIYSVHAVGHDGGMHVIAGEYHAGRNRAIKFWQAYLVR